MKNIIWFLYLILFFITLTIISKAVNKWSYHDNKCTIYSKIIDPYKLNSYEYNENIVNYNDINYPFIIKPIICSGANNGVQLIKNKKEFDKFNKTKSINEKYMIQEFYPTNYEVGLLYEKIPYITNGNIVSIVLKNKQSKHWEPLACENIKIPGVNCSTRNDLITEDLAKVIKKIADNIPGFYMGRFDIGFTPLDI
jgi:hypothetical protein